jgi:hypothetical protein
MCVWSGEIKQSFSCSFFLAQNDRSVLIKLHCEKNLAMFFHVSKMFLFFWSVTPCASPPPPRPSIFLFWLFFFRLHHLVNRDDRHLFAHAMASDFSGTRQCLSKRTIVFFCYVSNSTPLSG